MTFSVGVQARRAKHRTGKGMGRGNVVVMVRNCVCKRSLLAVTWHDPGCESKLSTFLLV